MKKLALLCITFLFTIHGKAQIPNPGFEIRKVDGEAANWLAGGFIVISTDSNCLYQGWDSIQTSTQDAHSGSYAYEIRVATACLDTYSGVIRPNRIDSVGFFDQRIPISGQPAAFTFYYKLDAVQGDSGVAEAFMEDLTGGAVGKGSIQVSAVANWTLATIPMSYTANDTNGYLRLKFYLRNAAGLHYGTRFVVDDMGQTAPTGIRGTAKPDVRLICFPSPAPNSVHISLNEAVAGANARVTITDIAGRIVMNTSVPVPQDKTLTVDTHALAPGVYHVRITESAGTGTGTFHKIVCCLLSRAITSGRRHSSS